MHSTFYKCVSTRTGTLRSISISGFAIVASLLFLFPGSTQTGNNSQSAHSFTTSSSSLEKPVSERRYDFLKGGRLQQWVVKKASFRISKWTKKLEQKSKNRKAAGVTAGVFLILAALLVGGFIGLFSGLFFLYGPIALGIFFALLALLLATLILIAAFKAFKTPNEAKNPPEKKVQ